MTDLIRIADVLVDDCCSAVGGAQGAVALTVGVGHGFDTLSHERCSVSKSPAPSPRPGFSKPWTKGTAHRIEIGQVFPSEVTVVAWSNHQGVVGTWDHPGHAALLMRKKREQDMAKVFSGGQPNDWPHYIRAHQAYRYFSFFPYGDQDKSYGKSNFQTGRKGRFSTSYYFDMNFEMSNSAADGLREGRYQLQEGQYYLGQYQKYSDVPTPASEFGTRADMIVQIPMQTGEALLQFGLSAYHMCEDANNFKKSDDFAYFFISKTQNCAGVAARILHAGGATAFSSLPTIGYKRKSVLYMTPNDVVAYAIATVQGVMQMNIILQFLTPLLLKKSQNLTNDKKFSKDNPFIVYSVEEWKKRSSVHLASRRGLTSDVDQALTNFHGCKWNDDYPGKMEAACKLFYYIYRYFKLGKTTQRQDAYVMLGHQLLQDVRSNVNSFAMLTWPAAKHYGINK